METHCADETWPKRTDDNRFRSTSKLFTNCPRRGKDVIIRRRDKGEWRVKQCDSTNVSTSPFHSFLIIQQDGISEQRGSRARVQRN